MKIKTILTALPILSCGVFASDNPLDAKVVFYKELAPKEFWNKFL